MANQKSTARISTTALLAVGLVASGLTATTATASNLHDTDATDRLPARFVVTLDDNATERIQRGEGTLDSITSTEASVPGTIDTRSGAVPVSGKSGELDTTIVTAEKPLNDRETADLQSALRKLPGVKSVKRDMVMTIQAGPNDTDYSKQWDLAEPRAGMRLPISSTSYPSGAGTRVAVIDTGKTNHPDLRGVFAEGADVLSDPTMARDGDGRDTDASDEGDWTRAGDCGRGSRASNSSWHGTHVAGTIGALTNNRQGIAGVAPGTTIVPVRALGRCGGYDSDIVAGVLYAAGQKVDGINRTIEPVDVINMSLGGRGDCSEEMQKAVDIARENGVTVVVAAGNSNRNARYFSPANCRGVVTVASTGRDGDRAYYSNYGSTIDIAAPGGDQSLYTYNGIYSTVLASKTSPTSEAAYSFSQGTSMAAPHVAGLAALVKNAKPGFTPTQVEAAIRENARPVPGKCYMGCGDGLIDATATLKAVNGIPDGDGDGDGDGDVTPITGGFLIDFETNQKAWTESRYGIINADRDYPAASGKYKAELNGFAKTNIEHITANIEIPSNAKKATLEFKLLVDSKEFGTRTAWDRLFVMIDGKEIAQYSNRDKGSRYVTRSVDVSEFIGKKVALRFEGREDSSGRTTFLVDDVALKLAK